MSATALAGAGLDADVDPDADDLAGADALADALAGAGASVDAAPDTRHRAGRTPRRLRLVSAVDRPRRRPRVGYALTAVGGALAIAAAQMGLSILATQSSYELDALTREQRDLGYQRQILDDAVAGLSSPQYLAANAAALGMVIDQAPSFLRLSDAAVLGAGGAADPQSSIDALGRGAVSNALVKGTPLVTAPEATIEGAPLPGPSADPQAPAPTAPPAIAEGLPSPVTH